MSADDVTHERTDRTDRFFRQFFAPEIRDDILSDIEQVLTSGRLMLGPFNERLEAHAAEFLEQPFAASVNSCTTALTIALRHYDVAGFDVLIPAANFISAATAVLDAGARPVLVDVVPETLSFNLEDLSRKRTPETRGVVWPHLLGIVSPDWQDIVGFCRDSQLFLVEDCAQALGAEIDGHKAGALGDVACLSFYATKIVASGSGGMLVTSDENLDARARRLRLFGRNPKSGQVEETGNDWFLDEFRAVVAYHHFRQLDTNLDSRRQVAQWYRKQLADAGGVSFFHSGHDAQPAYYQFAVLLDEDLDRDQVVRRLKEDLQVAAQAYYVPLHGESTLEYLDPGDLVGTESLMNRVLCLPLHHELTESDVIYISEAIREVIGRQRDA
jgi:perosamine synthetase